MSTPGAQLGRFRVEAILGQGSFGSVVKAYDTLLKESVALKVLRHELAQDRVAIERLRREVLVARKIDHPAVCRIHDLQQEGDTLFIVMELVEGRTLDSLLEHERLPPEQAVRILERVARALAAAHAAGVLHRDIKPGNVMVRPDGEVALVDFGIATMQGMDRLTRPGIALGTMGYLAPELWGGSEATETSDVFGAGVLLYASLTRRFPWRATGLQLLQQMKSVPPAPPSLHAPDIDPLLDRITLAAIAVDPGKRTRTAEAFADALAGWLHARPVDVTATVSLPGISPAEAGASQTLPSTTLKVPTVATGGRALAVGALVGLIGAGALIAVRGSESSPTDAGAPAIALADAGVVAVTAQPAASDAGVTAQAAVDASVSAPRPIAPERKRPPADRASVEKKLRRLQQRAGDRSSPALDKLAGHIADDIAQGRYQDADQKLDRALALVR